MKTMGGTSSAREEEGEGDVADLDPVAGLDLAHLDGLGVDIGAVIIHV